MLNELINAITRTGSSIAYNNPAGYGINNVPISQTFGKLFNSLIGAFVPGIGGGGGGGFGSVPMQGVAPTNIANPGFGAFGGLNAQQAGFGGVNPAAMQAFMNAQNQFGRGVNVKAKNRALAPGAVLINSFATPAQATQALPPPSLAQAFGGPFQGFAGQAGAYGSPAGFNPAANSFSPNVPYQGQGGLMQGIGGKFALLLSPLIGIVSLAKAFFNLKGISGTLQSVKIDKNKTGYYNYQAYADDSYEDGSFDEPEPYEGSGFSGSEHLSLSENLSGA